MLLFFGWLALVGGGYFLAETAWFVARATKAEGVVVALETGRRYRSRRPVIEFVDRQGKTNRVSANFSSRPALFRVGQKVTVLYEPSTPKSMRIQSFTTLWEFPAVAMGLGVMFILVIAYVRHSQRAETRQTD